MKVFPWKQPRRLFRREQPSAAHTLFGFFPLSPTGCLVLILSVLALWFQGIRQQDFVFLAIGISGCLVLLLMLLLVTVSAFLLRLRCRRFPTQRELLIECGTERESQYRIPISRWLPLVEYSWTWNSPPQVETRNRLDHSMCREVLLPHHRGLYTAIVRYFVVKDVLGLISIGWIGHEAAEIRFLPAMGAMKSLKLLESLAGGNDLPDPRGALEGDRIDMRQYTPGDAPRTIMWKVYARTRRLMVRVPERAVAARHRVCAYFVAGDDDEPAAGFMRAVLESGLLGDDWRFGADGSAAFARKTDEALTLLMKSANLPKESVTGFPEFYTQAQKDGFSSCLLVLPPTDGLWSSAVISMLSQSTLPVHAYTAVEKLPAAEPAASAVEKFFCMSRQSAIDRAPNLAWMSRAFESCRTPLFVVERSSGSILEDVRRLPARARGGRR
jgi:hypothetical protein